jgi:hypothetical protein
MTVSKQDPAAFALSVVAPAALVAAAADDGGGDDVGLAEGAVPGALPVHYILAACLPRQTISVLLLDLAGTHSLLNTYAPAMPSGWLLHQLLLQGSQ